MKASDTFYKKLDVLREEFRKRQQQQSGNHFHYCPKCRVNKPCPQITHCRKNNESVCIECQSEEL